MNTVNANKHIKHFKLSKNFSICTCCYTKLTTVINKIECAECKALELYFRGNYKEVLCYSRNDLVKKGILKDR